MTHNLFIFTTYYILILISILGYGLFFLKLLKIRFDYINFGYSGLFGIYILLVYSYLSNLFIPHNEIHNLTILFIGLFAFIFSVKKNILNIKKRLFLPL